LLAAYFYAILGQVQTLSPGTAGRGRRGEKHVSLSSEKWRQAAVPPNTTNFMTKLPPTRAFSAQKIVKMYRRSTMNKQKIKDTKQKEKQLLDLD